MKKATVLENKFAERVKEYGLPTPTQQYQFASPRRFLFDFAWPSDAGGGVAVELQGGTWVNGWHNGGTGIENDCDKANVAVDLGWQVFHFTTSQFREDPRGCCALVKRALDRVRSTEGGERG